MILGNLNIEKSFAKLMESTYSRHKGYIIEKMGSEYMVMDQRFNTIEDAKKYVDNKLTKKV